MMELKWTSKALPDLVRLYDFLAPVNKQAAARIVQSLTAAPARLKEIHASEKNWKSSNRVRFAASW